MAAIPSTAPAPPGTSPSLALPAPLRAALDASLGAERRLVLAVSGGLDSMVLLHAVAAWRADRGRGGGAGEAVAVTVATFDHGTGAAAREAVQLVRREARRLALPVVVGRAHGLPPSEAAWRAARWRFLRREARQRAAAIATAHTRDDQLETVVLRLLRGTGPRGLAALAAPPLPGRRGAVRRPWLGLSRAELAAAAAAMGVPWVEDPSNARLHHRRNRVRHQLLPALRRADPAAAGALLAVAERAARWRAAVDRLAAALAGPREADGSLSVARAVLRGYSPDELGVLWPALAARAGVRLDRQGTRRLAQFTNQAGRLARVPLAGGAEVVVLPERFLVRRRAARDFGEVPLAATLRVAGWHLHSVSPAVGAESPWVAALPADRRLTVRSWRPGDRIQRAGPGTARRVKRFLAEAGIPGPLRTGWPVVLAEGEIVWIPGVCRGAAATARPGRPAIYFRCERNRC